MRFALAVMLSLVLVGVGTARGAHAAPVIGEQSACIERTAAGAGNQATLVVTFDGGLTRSFCIEFSEDSISGMELLQRSGLLVVTSSQSQGAAVCSIDGVGCNDPGDCFCHCGGGTCEYWVYYRYEAGAWQYSPTGAGSRIVRNGDVDGWVWGSGGDPPDASGEICPELTPEPSPLPSAIPPPSSTPALAEETSPTVPAQESATSVPVAPASTATPAPLPGVATAGTKPQPTSAVLSEGRPPPTAATASAATSTPRTTTSRTSSPRTPTGAIQVSDDEGERNLAGRGDGGRWNWRSTAKFGGVAVLLLSIGGAVVWRRRARI